MLRGGGLVVTVEELLADVGGGCEGCFRVVFVVVVVVVVLVFVFRGGWCGGFARWPHGGGGLKVKEEGLGKL